MKDLNEYINNINKIDLHAHTFGVHGEMPCDRETLHIVDNSICDKYENDKLLPYFIEHFEKTNYKYNLIVGQDGEETKKIWNKYKDKAIGFGEVKIFKDFYSTKDLHHQYENWDVINGILSLKTGYPIWIHYDLDDKSYPKLLNLIENNKDHTFVLCHCGMNETYNKNKAFELSRELQLKNDNVWLDISWVALDYFDKEKMALLDPNRLLVGSDISKQSSNNSEILTKMEQLSKYISPYVNLNRIISTKYKYKKYI